MCGVLLSQNFVDRQKEFAVSLTGVLQVDESAFLETIELDRHVKQKFISDDIYVKKHLYPRMIHDLVTGLYPLLAAKALLKRVLGTQRFYSVVDRFYLKEHEVDRADDDELRRIGDRFRDSNDAVAGRFGLDHGTLAAYSYLD